jgi:hypothetical protein
MYYGDDDDGPAPKAATAAAAASAAPPEASAPEQLTLVSKLEQQQHLKHQLRNSSLLCPSWSSSST